jgi:hypothetical protein
MMIEEKNCPYIVKSGQGGIPPPLYPDRRLKNSITLIWDFQAQTLLTFFLKNITAVFLLLVFPSKSSKNIVNIVMEALF